MVYRSSRRPPKDNEETHPFQEEMNVEETKNRRPQGEVWRAVAIVFIVICVILVFGLITMGLKSRADDVPVCGTGSTVIPNVIDLLEPEQPGPFHDLTKAEIRAVLAFLRKDPDVRLKPVEEADSTDNFVFMMDLLPAKKADVTAFLAGNRSQPDRHARVILFRKDLKPPMVHELSCGPLPGVTSCPLIKSNSRRNPVEYSLRPIGSNFDMYGVTDVLFTALEKQIGYILLESYGTSFTQCQPDKCLKAIPAPIGTNLLGNINFRRIWFSAYYPVEYYIEHKIDFGLLANLDDMDPSNNFVSGIWYHGQYFDSVEDFIKQYNSSSISKSRLKPPPDNPRDSFSSMFAEEPLFPDVPLRPPTLVEPDGKRYSLKHREVEYLGWKFNFRMSPLSGPSLSNIRFRGETIAYELGLAEIAVFYSGDEPMQRATDFIDSGALLGTHAKSLVPGGDCPETATFIGQTFPSQDVSEPVHIRRAFCLFENNHGYPARRHLSYSKYEGAFYGGMLESALTLRTILTVVNYDYVFDFIFHQTGAIQTRVMSTGYILPAFFRTEESLYGFRTEENFLATIHHHMFHFKADLDISGQSNRYETLNIRPEKVTMRTPPKAPYHQTKVERKLYTTEQDALFKFDFDQPKYHIVHNEAQKTKHGSPKAYRIGLAGMSKQLVPEMTGNEGSVSWSRHQMVVTKHKDDEQLSSSPYAMHDSLHPVTDFSQFYSDDENIVDEDLVFWITCGVHHIPHTEDLPITPTVGTHLQFFLMPYNYFPRCPSIHSRDHIRIQHKNKSKKGVIINRNGYNDNQCRKPQTITEYTKLLEEDPDSVVESTRPFPIF